LEQKERKIIEYFLRVYDPELLELFEAEDFDFPPNRILFQLIKNYGIRYGNTPSFEVLTQQLQEVKRVRNFHELEASYIAETLSSAFTSPPWREDEVEFWKDYAFEYLRARRIEKALRSAASSIREDRFDNVLETVRQLIRLEKGKVEFENWGESVEKRKLLAEELWSIRKIPTPFSSLNLLLRGGLCPGQLGVIVAPPKIGKSFLLVLLGDEAAKRGFNVLHMTLEMSADEVLFRYDTRASGGRYTLDEIQQGRFDPEVVLKGISKRKGRVVVTDVSTRRCTLATIEALYDKAEEREGVQFDVLLLDYANLVRADFGDNLYKNMDIVSSELHSFAKEKNVAIWTIARTNRSALVGTVQKQHIGESYALMYNCDVLLSIEPAPSDDARKREEKERRELMADKMGFSVSDRKKKEEEILIGDDDDDETPFGKRKLLMRCLFIRNAPHFGKIMTFLMDYKKVDFEILHCHISEKLSPEELKRALENEQVVLR